MEGGEGIGDCHAPLRGARNDREVVCHCEEPVFWATWQSLVSETYWGLQKRDCHGPWRGLAMTRERAEARNDKRGGACNNKEKVTQRERVRKETLRAHTKKEGKAMSL